MGQLRLGPWLVVAAAACGNDREPDLTGELACDTLTILETRCGACHGDPPAKGAPMSLVSIATLRGGSSVFGGRSIAAHADAVTRHADAARVPRTGS